MRFLGYCRASTDEQRLTIDAQHVRLEAWARFSGHEIEVFHETGVSGSVAPDEREVLASLLERLAAKDADGLVFCALDRVSRSTRDVIDLVERAEDGGWTLVSLRESLDTSSAIGRFVVRTIASLGELERDLIGERTSQALAQLRSEGKRFSRHAPWGRQYAESGALVPNPVEEMVADAFPSLTNDGYYLDIEISLILQTKYGNHPRTKRPWSADDVRRLRRILAERRQKEPA